MGIPIRNLDEVKVSDVDLYRRHKQKETKKSKRKMIECFSANSGHLPSFHLRTERQLSICLKSLVYPKLPVCQPIFS